jgi:hypothetical protein
MKSRSIVTSIVAGLCIAAGGYAFGASTQPTLVDSYNQVADSILATHRAERAIVGAILQSHLTAGRNAAQAGKWDEAAAEVALLASEGDNAIGGIRKRLLEGGHHANSDGEAKGIFDPGFVIITVEARKTLLGLVPKIQSASDDAGRKAAWADVEKTTTALLGRK